jgi:hypothetical protein
MIVAETRIAVALLFNEVLQLNIQLTCMHGYINTAAAAAFVLTLVHLDTVIS